jgi:ankyrin repeat protein
VHKDWRAAADRGDLESLERMLDAGFDVDARDDHGQTALMNAARHGRTRVVRLLVDRGGGLNYTAKYGLTALMLAVVAGHADVVRILVEAGADLEARGTGAPGFAGRTALDLAEAIGSQPVVQALRQGRPAS